MNLKFSTILIATCVISAFPQLAISADKAAGESGKGDEQSAQVKADSSSGKDDVTTDVLASQVLLDRLQFSPGAIDGLTGRNAALARKAFQKANGLEQTGEMNDATSEALHKAAGVDKFLQDYKISPEDAQSKFLESLPEDMAASAKVDALSYTSLKEMLAERFHTTPKMLERLNPQTNWKEGETITVPNVFPTLIRNGAAVKSKDSADDSSVDTKNSEKSSGEEQHSATNKKPDGPVKIIVTKDDTSLNLLDKDGKIIFHAPVSAGSEHDPLPLGDWKVNGVEKYPTYNYNPELFWDAESSDKKAKIPAGPNNPVGVAWIDITKPHYGIHGTPNPEKIGYTESHGCVRLTNWDVIRLSALVKPGTKVEFVEKAK